MANYIVEFKNVVINYELRKYSLCAVNDFSLGLEKAPLLHWLANQEVEKRRLPALY